MCFNFNEKNKKMETFKKICPYTKKSFYGRANQIYFNRQAQLDFNNMKARKKRLAKSPVDKALDKNRTILILILNEQNEVVRSKDFLLGAGFDFKYFSRSTRLGDKPCQVVYEFCVIHLHDDQYKVKRLK
jgi:hypothetical protein